MPADCDNCGARFREGAQEPSQRFRGHRAADEIALSLVAPISVPPLSAVVLDRSRLNAFGGSIWDRTVDAKSRILATVTELSGAQLSRVDIRISGIRTSEGGRVR